jgi:hypothetical protein
MPENWFQTGFDIDIFITICLVLLLAIKAYRTMLQKSKSADRILLTLCGEDMLSIPITPQSKSSFYASISSIAVQIFHLIYHHY